MFHFLIFIFISWIIYKLCNVSRKNLFFLLVFQLLCVLSSIRTKLHNDDTICPFTWICIFTSFFCSWWLLKDPWLLAWICQSCRKGWRMVNWPVFRFWDFSCFFETKQNVILASGSQYGHAIECFLRKGRKLLLGHQKLHILVTLFCESQQLKVENQWQIIIFCL